MKLGEAIWTVHLDHMRALEHIVDVSGTRGESGVLLFLYHVGRPMFPGELTEKLGLTTGRIANILKVLEKSGMVVRTADAQDKRRVQVVLTPEGEALARRKNDSAIRYHAELVRQLGEGEAQQLLGVIRHLVEIVDRTPFAD